MAIECLKDLLNLKKYKCFEAAKSQIMLKEAKKGQKKHQIFLDDCPDGMVAVRLPDIAPNVFKNNSDGIENLFLKISDYLLFIPDNDDVDVVICEMKKAVSADSIGLLEAGQQVKCTIPLLHYIMQGVETHFDKSMKPKLHYVILCEEFTPKDSVNLALIDNHALSKEINDDVMTDKVELHTGSPPTPYTFEYGKITISVVKGIDNISLHELIG